MESLWSLLSVGADGWGDEILAGSLLTISLALCTLPIGLVIGFFIALAKNSGEPTLVTASNIYTTIFRGLPELLTLFIIYFGVQIALKTLLALVGLPPIEINSFVAGMIALSLVFSSFSSEVFLSAFKGVASGQYEGADALGLTRFQTMRLVILPQIIRLALPGLSNLWLILLKDTSLVSVIGLSDILRQTSIAARVTREPFFFFFVACMIYLVLSIISSFGIGRIEAWTRRGEAR
ncbi:Histidine transport system permease protein HisQ [Hartmannibacter diazotrophicus]|uniref:Histidine transport system permease protein HisQ n=1 Tax=Hartmannibacter diazotrophicus TaxID=1482074 RepID=A0A2C9D8E9_9HYPH|nr:ABC transporter permease [Hartmannibacter diazotrophicus]SON56450.1 Histidine transport system permease protein HisQ [Hartmannibacter diazotrophicus]